MEYRDFEQRLLGTIFTTDVPINPATVAFLYKVTVQEASDLLQQAAVHGLLNIESDDEGNILYVFPNRQRIPGRDGKPATPGTPNPPGAGATALARLAQDVAGTVLSSARTPILPPEHIDMLEAAGGPSSAAGTPAAPLVTASPTPAIESTRPVEPAAAGAQTTRCRFCAEVILVGAKKCKHCHEYLDDALRELQVQRGQINQLVAGQMGHAAANAAVASSALVPSSINRDAQQLQAWNSTTSTQAALLSFFVPGLGQMCSGRVPAGLLWMMFTCLGYVCFIVPGIVLHILCVINASRQPQQQLT